MKTMAYEDKQLSEAQLRLLGAKFSLLSEVLPVHRSKFYRRVSQGPIRRQKLQ